MLPNKVMREFSLIVTSKVTFMGSFAVGGILSLVPGILCLMSRNIFTSAGFYLILFSLIMFAVAFLFIPLVFKLMRRGEQKYEVSPYYKVPKEQLLYEVSTYNTPNSKYIYEVNDDWIDISYNWKNCLSIQSGLLKEQSIYKKLIRLNDDFTYDELDFICTGEVNIGLGTINFANSMRCGHFSNMTIEVKPSIDMNGQGMGINSYTLNTVEITNMVRKWLADRGYEQSGY